ncbi:SDR family NAD(P)-dependent oxidoreductase [Paenibacillus sp. S3N08]|uniref:SDR family NAD(P)-dependent oxidoreductase n=1 Tax=Paenibacillus agricola TaxID=2716264 RepID=A0ABX0JAH8_9BACL|nr:SDR family NAD(P)-dependent oxidoreductase [Paenibacillus agricola]
MELRGKTAIIRGAGKGIGQEIAKSLARAGIHVGLMARSASNLEALCAELQLNDGTKICFATASASHYEEVERATNELKKELGPIDYLITVINPGLGKSRSLAESAPDEWRRNIEVNVLGMYHMNRAVIQDMIERQSGMIINVFTKSEASGEANESANTAAKFALIGMTESLCREVSDHHIHVIALAPDTIDREAAHAMGVALTGEEWLSQAEEVAELTFAIIKHPEAGIVKKGFICISD